MPNRHQEEPAMTIKEQERQKRLVKKLGGATEIHEGLRAYSNRVEQMEARRAELTKQYPDKWVAMANRDIVAVAESLTALITEVDKQGIPRFGLVVEYLDTKPRNMIL